MYMCLFFFVTYSCLSTVASYCVRFDSIISCNFILRVSKLRFGLLLQCCNVIKLVSLRTGVAFLSSSKENIVFVTVRLNSGNF
jgi:hypothetical protein